MNAQTKPEIAAKLAALDPERRAFLQQRMSGVGGSDVAAIMGLSKYKTPYALWLEKTGREIDTDMSEPAYWGITLEDVVAKEFAKRTDLKVQRVNQQLEGAEPWMLANIDRAIVNPEISGNVRAKDGALTTDQILEVKTASGWLADLWGESQTDQVPDYYLTQCTWYMGITGTRLCHLAVLIGGQQFKHFEIEFDAELFDMLVEKARAFWQCVINDTPPDPETFSDLTRLCPEHEAGKCHEADSALIEKINECKELKRIAKEASDAANAAQFEVAKAMGDAESVTDAGKTLLTYKTQTASRIDSKALKAEAPELAAKYTTQTTSRVMRIK